MRKILKSELINKGVLAKRGMFTAARCESRSCCAHQARLLLKMALPGNIDAPVWYASTSKWAIQWWLSLPDKTRAELLEEILDDEELHMLTRHRCPALALETVREAKLLLTSATAYDSCSEHQLLWLRVITIILQNPPYSGDASMAMTLAWAVPKHKGHGMQCLKVLHDQR